jgi:hypothetical protein
MRRIVKQYPKSFLLITLALCAAVVFIWCGKYTVTSGKKHDSFSGVSYGYQIEQYYFWNSTRITIWNRRGLSYGMEAVYDFPSLTVEKVIEERWLKNDLAIYLNLEIKYHDSLVSVHPARMIYDFHRGEMHTSSGFTLWRIWNEKNKSEDWMTETEFDAILNGLSG